MREEIIEVKLMVDLQYPEWFKKGDKFLMNKETGDVFGYEPSKESWMEYPIRRGIAGYLWLLKTEGNKFLKEIK